MAEVYKLPGSSYEEIVKIIRAYALASKNGAAVTLAEVAQSSGIDKTIISRNNGFLMQIKLLLEGNRKKPTDLCLKLGRAYQLNMQEQIIECWNEIIRNDDFLSRMISIIQIKGEMSKSDFINHIVYSSSEKNTNNTRAGASAVIEMLKLTQIIEEHDGKISMGTGNVTNVEVQEKKQEPERVKNIVGIKNAENSIREIQNLEKEYYIQSYTCESGKAAKFIIPEDATEDDLLAFCDMLDIVLKRKFKIKMAE